MASGAAMKFSVEAAGPCRKRVSVNVPAELVSAEFEQSYAEVSKSVAIRGFRPGKAPRSIVEKRFGADIATRVKQTLIDNAFDEALGENDLVPVADPEMDVDTIAVERGQPITFEFTVTVKPEFDLPDLASIVVAVPAIDVSDSDIAEALERTRKREATLHPLEHGEVQRGDMVTLRVTAMSGETLVIDNAEVQYEIGSNQLADLIAEDLGDALVGKEPGATVNATGYVPPHTIHHPPASRELALEVEIIDAKRPALPEIDDDFAKGLDFDDQEELHDSVRKDVEKRLATVRERFIEDAALAQLVEATAIELPRALIENETDEIARRAGYEAQLRGDTDAEIAKSLAKIRTRTDEETARALKVYFILGEIVETERILVTEDEVREAVAQIAPYYGPMGDNLYAIMRDAGRLTGLRNQLRAQKARAKLRKKVEVDEAPN